MHFCLIQTAIAQGLRRFFRAAAHEVFTLVNQLKVGALLRRIDGVTAKHGFDLRHELVLIGQGQELLQHLVRHALAGIVDADACTADLPLLNSFGICQQLTQLRPRALGQGLERFPGLAMLGFNEKLHDSMVVCNGAGLACQSCDL